MPWNVSFIVQDRFLTLSTLRKPTPKIWFSLGIQQNIYKFL